MDVSRIHAGKLSISQTEVEIDVFLSEVLYSMQQIIQDHKIILGKNEPAKLEIDTLRLEQVITNLLTNAVKYSPQSNQVIINSIVKDEAILFSVQDFGIGIEKENTYKIFEKFYRAKTGFALGGLGLGLFISLEIVKAHKGNLWVESEPGKGSTFYFSLPLNA